MIKESGVIIKTSTNDYNVAINIASGLLNLKKAACVQIEAVDSFYIWQGKVTSDKEYVLNVKSLRSKASEIIQYIKARHNYSLPEVIQINIDDCSAEYLSWLIQETRIQIAN